MSFVYSRHFLIRFLACFAIGLASTSLAFSQSAPVVPHEYPRTVLYQGILHPLVTFSDQAPVVNFRNFYLVGFRSGSTSGKHRK